MQLFISPVVLYQVIKNSLTFSRKVAAMPAPQDPSQLQASKVMRLVKAMVSTM
jgi:hypothetical protein